MEITPRRRALWVCLLPLLALLAVACTASYLRRTESLRTLPTCAERAVALSQQRSALRVLDTLTDRARQTHGTTTVTTSEVQIVRQYVTLPHQ